MLGGHPWLSETKRVWNSLAVGLRFLTYTPIRRKDRTKTGVCVCFETAVGDYVPFASVFK